MRETIDMGKTELSEAVRVDYALLISSFLLIILGILTIYSAGSGTADMRASEMQHIKQMYWAVTGLVVFIAVLFINYQKLGENALAVYIGCIVLLVVTLLFGRRVRGAKSWLAVAGGFGFQPSEFVKIGVIIMLARFLEQVGEDVKRLRNLLTGLAILALPVGLILLQPDFGTALVYMPIGLAMLYFAGMRYIQLISLLIIFGIAGFVPLITTFGKLTHSSALAFLNVLDDPRVVLIVALIFGVISLVFFLIFRMTKKNFIYKATVIFFIFFMGLLLSAVLGEFLKPYQKERLVVFMRPAIDPFGAGYNIIQSKIAIGAGSVFGKGLLGGTQSQLGFLPERSTDFIFSIFAEEWGFVGSFFLIALYAIFIFRGIMIVYSTKDRFGNLLAAGIVAMFIFHLIVNIGMTIGIMPITGIPLPFMSYGGSFLVTCLVGTSILLNIEMRRFIH